MTVIDLKPGQKAAVTAIGTGDPLEITLRGYQLSLRKNEARQIEVQ